MGDPGTRKSPVQEHLDRCIELYGIPGDEDFTRNDIGRERYEQMRADLMLLLGIAVALHAKLREPSHD